MSKSIQLKNNNNEPIYPYAILKDFVLYDNSTGTNGDITLSDNITKYKYIEIFFKWNSSYKSVKLYKPAINNSLLLDMLDFTGQISFATKTITINSNTSIKVSRYKQYTIQDSISWAPYGSNANVIYVVRVVGYK